MGITHSDPKAPQCVQKKEETVIGTPPNNKGSSELRIKECQTKEEWKAHFNENKGNNKLVVVDFTATWCGPCRSMEPILKEFSESFPGVEFVKIDVDELPDVAAEFGVQAMPTFLLLKNGNQVDKVVGARKEDLKIKIEKHCK